MIILPKRRIYDAGSFAEGLSQASRGVMSMGAELELCSGWLITDTLAVVPAYGFEGNRNGAPITARFADMTEPVPVLPAATSFLAGKSMEELKQATLVRLCRPFSDRILTLASKELRTGEDLLILHHAGRKTETRVDLSFGRLLEEDPKWYTYDADTESGSGGGAIFAAGNWSITGMHMLSDRDRGANQGLTIAAILEDLRTLPEWVEIARHHRLADVSVAVVTSATTAGEQPPVTQSPPSRPDELLSTAVRWGFDPATLANRENILPLVINPEAKEWMLKPAERLRLLEGAGSLEALREARRALAENEVTASPAQKVIDRILAGPPYDLNQVDETLMPIWLQAVRWFSRVIPELPSPSVVNRNLEQRRIRSRLHDMTGKSADGKSGQDFCGRETELAELEKWYTARDSGPMVVSGLGGVGKSALVAKFALSLAGGTALLWLDFDRPDLAPDDVVSVLTVLAEQLLLQLPNFTPPAIHAEQWEECSRSLGKALANASAGSLMVLDGFEVAQRVQQYREIWKVLEAMLDECATLRVLVSGRARVKDLELNQRKASSLDLGGLAKPHVENWLKRHGIENSKVIDEIAAISRGLPLILRMAVYLVDSGGTNDILNLPADLNDSLREGYLYQRILDRVIDPALKPVAKDALVLRRLSEVIMSEVMADRLPPELPPPAAFARLQQDLSLIDDQGGSSPMGSAGEIGVIYLRPEIRSATLRLLEMDEPERVRELDLRAAEWYAKQTTAEVACAAELVYHRLRLDDLQAAKQAWVAGCELRLSGAEDELPESAKKARAWLRKKLENPDQATRLMGWEQESVKRIQSALSRGLGRAVKGILDEAAERSDNSPLVFYDAWLQFKTGDRQGALNTLTGSGEGSGEIRRNRLVLEALLARDTGDTPRADELLSTLEDPEEWPAWNGPEDPLRLAVIAARVRLTVDLDKELRLAGRLNKKATRSSVPLAGIDVMLPSLRRFASQSFGLESIQADVVPIPKEHRDLPEFSREIEERKGGSWPTDLSPDLRVLAGQTQKRWRLASSSLFLHETIQHAVNDSRAGNDLTYALAASLVPFLSLPLVYSHRGPCLLDQLLAECLFAWRRKSISLDGLPKPAAGLLQKVAKLEKWELPKGKGKNGSAPILLGNLEKICGNDTAALSLAFYLLSPDPLSCLCQLLADQRLNPPGP